MTDTELIKACLKHDRQSQKLLYERFHQQMYAICMRYCRQEFMAKEALQNGFIRVFINLNNFKLDLPLAPWIRAIMVNCSLDQLSKQKLTEDLNENSLVQKLTIVSHINEEMTAEEMMVLVNNMPEGYRTIFNMYVIDDLSHQEIAEILGIAESTSRTQLLKARRHLKNLLIKNYSQYL